MYNKPGLPCVYLKSFSCAGLIFMLDELSMASQRLCHASEDSFSRPELHSWAFPPTSLFCYCWLTLLVSGEDFYSVSHLPSRFPMFPPSPICADPVHTTCCHSLLSIQELTYYDLVFSSLVLLRSIALTLTTSTNRDYFNSLKVMRPSVL